MSHKMLDSRNLCDISYVQKYIAQLYDRKQWRTGGGEVQTPPPPRNSEGPLKSCQTQSDCENC